MEIIIPYLKIQNTQVSIIIIRLPYTTISAGFPSPAADYLEDGIDLNQLMIKTPSATFIVRVKGESMIGAFIPNDSLLIVDRSITAKFGDIVVASIDGELTVKYLIKTPEGVTLTPANPKYKPILITEEMSFQVWGVVTATVIINPKDL